MPFYTIYSTIQCLSAVDNCAVVINLPHWFDWNLFNNGSILTGFNTAIDLDGVICQDCPPESDDDGAKYLEWLNSAMAIRFPRDYNIPYIITARLEKYRPQTTKWLDDNKITYSELIMYPGFHEERTIQQISEWKAKQIAINQCKLYVESDYHLASGIAKLSPRARIISVEKPPILS
jgi:orotate phosphoribosyltransferase